NAITTQTGFYFSYDPQLVNSDQPLSITVQDQSVEALLKDVFKNKFQFKRLKNQLIITRNPSAAGPLITSPSDTENLRSIEGTIIDGANQERIPYASVSILGETLGTITNSDGLFALKIPQEFLSDTVVVSCMGYARSQFLLDTLQHNQLQLKLHPIEIRLKEVQVVAADPLVILDSMIFKIRKNYSTETMLMSAFYREVLTQDKEYVNVAEAAMDILKTPYTSHFREDQIRYLKGRKSKDVQPFQFVDFKMQGGPYYITKLDVIKTMDSFIDPDYRNYYHYELKRTIDYMGRPTLIVSFQPEGKFDYLTYEGELYIDQKTYALVHAEFSLSRSGKKSARRSLIRKKPKDFNVRPIDLNYQVSYKKYEGKWYLNSAQASVRFRVKSKRDKINSIFHSTSDLLITDYRETNLRRFKHHQSFDSSDIFSDIITNYDEDFWKDYNVIEPSKSLRDALQKKPQDKSLNQTNTKSNRLTTQH
ncbi:MAG TPA: carboxypeptidase-like regulatory domain-containing protein, partial [Sunxiuqinia sp.]|nr:carboxypeptidase-like regulatory domain-containing protein [Sunxiuqinia sp.]